MLRQYVSYRQDNWCEKIAYVEFACNNAKKMTTGQTPFRLNYGKETLEFSDLLLKVSQIQFLVLQTLSLILKSLHRLHQSALSNSISRLQRTKTRREVITNSALEIRYCYQPIISSYQRTRREGKR
jgi:hypothetical protein